MSEENEATSGGRGRAGKGRQVRLFQAEMAAISKTLKCKWRERKPLLVGGDTRGPR